MQHISNDWSTSENNTSTTGSDESLNDQSPLRADRDSGADFKQVKDVRTLNKRPLQPSTSTSGSGKRFWSKQNKSDNSGAFESEVVKTMRQMNVALHGVDRKKQAAWTEIMKTTRMKILISV